MVVLMSWQCIKIVLDYIHMLKNIYKELIILKPIYIIFPDTSYQSVNTGSA